MKKWLKDRDLRERRFSLFWKILIISSWKIVILCYNFVHNYWESYQLSKFCKSEKTRFDGKFSMGVDVGKSSLTRLGAAKIGSSFSSFILSSKLILPSTSNDEKTQNHSTIQMIIICVCNVIISLVEIFMSLFHSFNRMWHTLIFTCFLLINLFWRFLNNKNIIRMNLVFEFIDRNIH